MQFLYFYQNKLLYHPNINSRSNYELNHKVNEILITSYYDIISWHYKKNKNYKTLVFFHGNSGNLSNRIYKLNELSKIDTFVKTKSGFKVTGVEGFVAIDRTEGGAVKLVDRMEFSTNNFSKDIIKGWDNPG